MSIPWCHDDHAETPSASTTTGERADLLDVLQKHRGLFRVTVQDLSDEQARTRSTVSELTLGGLVKHVATTEKHWASFVQEGPAEDAIDWANVDWSNPPAEISAYADGFRMLDDETLAGLLEDYDDGGRGHRRPGRDRRPRLVPPAALGAVVQAGRPLVGPAGVRPHRGRDRPARRPRRHHPRGDRRAEEHGLVP